MHADITLSTCMTMVLVSAGNAGSGSWLLISCTLCSRGRSSETSRRSIFGRRPLTLKYSRWVVPLCIDTQTHRHTDTHTPTILSCSTDVPFTCVLCSNLQIVSNLSRTSTGAKFWSSFRSQIRCFVLPLRGDWCRKWRRNFAISHPLPRKKIREGMDKMSESV